MVPHSLTDKILSVLATYVATALRWTRNGAAAFGATIIVLMIVLGTNGQAPATQSNTQCIPQTRMGE